MKVLVTGGTGIIGRHAIASLLNDGHNVSIISRANNDTLPVDGAVPIAGDILETEFLRKIIENHDFDALLHLAWETRHGLFWAASENEDWLNASTALFRLFLKHGGKRIVSAGTCVEYDAPENGPCIAGKTPLVTNLPYAKAKTSLLLRLKSIATEHGANWAWGRIFLVTGPGEDAARLVPSVINSVLDGKEAHTTSGNQIRDVLHTSDCGAAFAKLITNRFTGEINVCRGKPVKLAEITTRIGQLMGRPDLIKIGAIQDRPGEPQNLWGDAGPLSSEIGFIPELSLEAMLQHSINWWQNVRNS